MRCGLVERDGSMAQKITEGEIRRIITKIEKENNTKVRMV